MASRTSTDPIEILLEMGVDLDNLSEEEDYLSALMEAVNTLTIKNAKDPRISPLQQEIVKVRKKRKAADTRFKARKTKISAGAFKKGSATGTNLKPKALPTSALVLYQAPEAATEEEGGEKKKRKRKPKEKNLLKEIAKSVTNIADTLKKQYDLKKKFTEEERRRAEQQKRKLQEAGLEKRFEGILKTAQKIIAPIRSIFDRIIQFLTMVFLGKFLSKLVDWFTNPENQSKIKSIIRFLSDNWPKLLSAYIIFGTGLGKFSRFLVKVLARGAVRLAAATAGLLARLFGGRALGRFSRFLGKRGKLIAGGVEAVTTIFAFKALEDAFTKNLGPEQSASIDNDIPVSGYQGGGLVQPIFKFGGGGRVNLNLISSNGVLGYEEGGEVDGPAGIDKVPAMLTDGEFVMSRGAVQKYGLAQLEAMNAAGGGTNKPKVMNGTVFAVGGGYFGDREKAPDRNLTPVNERPYSTGSLASDPLGALDRILGQSSGGKFRLPGRGPKSQPESKSEPPKSQPEPPKPKPKEPLIPESPSDRVTSNEKGFIENLTGPGGQTFLDSGLVYLSQMMGTAKPITEKDFGEESEKQLLLAVERAKKRQKNALEAQRAKVARYVAQGYETSEEGRRALAIERSHLQKLEEGKIQVKYQDYYDGNDPKNMTESAENAKRIFGQFWAKKRSEEEGGGYRVEDKYDFDMFKKKDEKTGKMRDATNLEVADIAMSGLPLGIGGLYRGVKSAITGEKAESKSLQQSLQALYLLNPFKSEGKVDTVLGGKERDLPFISNRGDGRAAFGGKITPESLMGTDKATLEKPKLTAAQIKNNQAYAASKGKYYSNTTGKTYANYAAALKDPQVAAAAKIEETKKKLSFAPTQPVKSSPSMPSYGSNGNVTVLKVPAKNKTKAAESGSTAGSNTPNINAGNGDSSKFKIYGFSPPSFLQF